MLVCVYTICVFVKYQKLTYSYSSLFKQQINDLQMSLSRAEQQFSRKEMSLRQEISDLQQGLQESEGRNQELSQSVTGGIS